MAGSLRQKAARGVLVIVALKVAGTVIGRITAVVLPLYLLPADFGIFALAAFYSGILAVVGDLGMSRELVRRKERFEEAANTAFILRLALSVVLVAGSGAVGWVVSVVYDDPRLAFPILVMGLAFIFQSLALVPRILATRDLDFRRAAVPDSTGKFSAAFVTVGLAILGLAYWSPVYGALFGAALGAALQLLFTRWRPRLRYDRGLAREIVHFGQFVTLASFANFVAHSVDNAFVGYLLGVTSLGFYAFAYSWGVYFTSNLTSIFATVGFPVLSSVSDAPDRFRRAFSENLRYYGYAGFCLGAGVFVLAPVFTHALYGPTWVGAIVPMQVLAPAGILLGFAGVAADVLFALGRPRTVFLASAAELGVLLALLPAATLIGGIVGTSLAALVGAGLVTAVLAARASVLTGLHARSWLSLLAPSAIAAAVASLSTGALLVFLGTNLVALLAGLSTFLGTYGAALQALTRGRFLSDVRNLVRLAVVR